MKDPVCIFGCGRGFHLPGSRSEPCVWAGLTIELRGNERALPKFGSPERCVMPAWMEILINVIGYAGFIAIATWHKSPGKKSNDPRAANDRR